MIDLHSPYPLTPEHGTSFDEQGYIVLTDVLSPQTVRAYEPEITSKVFELNTQHLPVGERLTAAQRAALQVMNVWQESELVREFVFSPRLARLAAELLGVDAVRIYHDQAIYKEPGGGITPWHADQYYWPLQSDRTCSIWIPLQDTPEEMGPVIYIDGSHKWPDTESMRHFNSQDLDALEAQLMGEGSDSKRRVIALKKGQMSFHHSRMIHGSDVNRGSFPRTSIALHMQDEKNRHQIYRSETGEPWHITNDDLCRKDANGHPDYTDPSPFPVLFSAKGS